MVCHLHLVFQRFTISPKFQALSDWTQAAHCFSISLPTRSMKRSSSLYTLQMCNLKCGFPVIPSYFSQIAYLISHTYKPQVGYFDHRSLTHLANLKWGSQSDSSHLQNLYKAHLHYKKRNSTVRSCLVQVYCLSIGDSALQSTQIYLINCQNH